MSRRTTALVALLCWAGMSAPASADLPSPEKRIYRSAEGVTLPYRLAKPHGHDPKRAYPLILFLHGAGERGDDNVRQLNHALPVLLSDKARKKYPCFLLAPQCPADKKWTGTNWQADDPKQTREISATLALVLELLGAVQKEFRVDTKRIYVTGVSMGGSATWDLATRRPELFAAAVPICGGCDAAGGAKLAKLPVWAFQGAKDAVVKPELPRRMVQAIRKAGGKPIYTEYADRGHDIWRQAYTTPKLLPWLFDQRLP